MKKIKSILSMVVVFILLFSNGFAFDVITDETAFYAYCTKGALITNLGWRGDGSYKDYYVIRGYKDGMHWERVSGSSYPISIDTNGPSSHRLSVMAPTNATFSAVPIAVYTDVGFKGIVPGGGEDKFYPLYASSITAMYVCVPK